MTFDLNFHMHRLLRSEPFFAAFSRQVDKREDTSIPTAAIGFDRETLKFYLLYNPSFMESLSDVHKIGVLKHEFYHLILSHVTTRIPYDRKTESHLAKTWNIAADLSINQYLIEELPDFACIPGKNKFVGYPLGLTAEAYFEKLKKDKSKSSNPNEGQGMPDTLDDHSKWDEFRDQISSDSDLQKIFDEKLREVSKNAAEEASNSGASGWGTVPSSIRNQLAKLITVVISPEKVLRYFIKTSVRSDTSTTIRRINPRYPYIHPGVKHNRIANVAISIDQSGSVNNKMLQTFFSFLNGMGSHVTFTVIPFDCSVNEKDIYIWKKGEKRKWERVKSGGTDFNAPTRWVNGKSFDGHIILTDMQAPKPIASKCQRLWVTDSNSAKQRYFNTNEKVIVLD